VAEEEADAVEAEAAPEVALVPAPVLAAVAAAGLAVVPNPGVAVAAVPNLAPNPNLVVEIPNPVVEIPNPSHAAAQSLVQEAAPNLGASPPLIITTQPRMTATRA